VTLDMQRNIVPRMERWIFKKIKESEK